MTKSKPHGSQEGTGYRRSVGTPRSARRKDELLDAVAEDLEAHGLVGFTLRRAASAAGTGHKTLLYHFDDLGDLMVQALGRIRQRRVQRGLEAIAALDHPDFAGRVLAAWRALSSPDGPSVLDQATGLSMYDPERYGVLGQLATEQYLEALVTICPPEWPAPRQQAVAAFLLATLRGLLCDLRSSGDRDRVDASLGVFLEAISDSQR